ncbi:MAG: RDD family protein [Terriglobales bacterium]
MNDAATTGLTTIGSPPAGVMPAGPSSPDASLANPIVDDSTSWRGEVAARLERYRTRRKPRAPHYPSLLLPFDAPESWSRPAPPTGFSAVTAAPDRVFRENSQVPSPTNSPTDDAAIDPGEQADTPFAASCQPSPSSQNQTHYRDPDTFPEQFSEPSAKVIEFPRSAAIPVFHSSELADPIFDRPRIVEAPEILPPPPALGGILIEPARRESLDQSDLPPFASPSASISRRALAALVDGLIVATALTAFGAIFLRLNPNLTIDLNSNLRLDLNLLRGVLPILAGAFVLVAGLLWIAYEFFFVVYTGSTPGLRAARLRLASFDGSSLNRRSRRWRVLASFLSAFSAGLGYLWSALDQDGLCWHDRITRTHVTPAPPKKKSPGRRATGAGDSSI